MPFRDLTNSSAALDISELTAFQVTHVPGCEFLPRCSIRLSHSQPIKRTPFPLQLLQHETGPRSQPTTALRKWLDPSYMATFTFFSKRWYPLVIHVKDGQFISKFSITRWEWFQDFRHCVSQKFIWVFLKTSNELFSQANSWSERENWVEQRFKEANLGLKHDSAKIATPSKV